MFIYEILFKLTNNFYISLGFAIAFFIIILLALFFFLFIAVAALQAKIAGEKLYPGIVKRDFARARPTWKRDIIIGTLAFLIGLVTMLVLGPPLQYLDFYQAISLLVKDYRIFIPTAALSLGPAFIYLAIENLIKRVIAERHVGKKLVTERDLILVNAAKLKESLIQLKRLLETLDKEGFDVGVEYDVLHSVSAARIDTLSKKIDSYSKRVIEDELAKVEDAIENSQERKRVADEHWLDWDAKITGLLEESEEIHTNSLMFIPTSLRTWAMRKYTGAHSKEGLSLEGNAIKREVLTPEKIASRLITKKLLRGCILVKNNEIVFSSVSGASPSVFGALMLKLLGYAELTPKHIGRYDFDSMAAIGDHYVLMLTSHRTFKALLLIHRTAFKDVMNEWMLRMENL